jgi:hypothetical protein
MIRERGVIRERVEMRGGGVIMERGVMRERV